MTGNTPPSRGEQLCPSFSLHELQVYGQRHPFQMPTLWVSAVSEIKLFFVGTSERPDTEQLDGDDGERSWNAEINRVEGEVPSLESVCEWYPNEITE